MRVLLPAICILVLFTGCGGENRTSGTGNNEQSAGYARRFEITETSAGRIISVINPWQGADNIRFDYFLSENGSRPDGEFSGEIIDIPLRRVICMSSSHVAFISACGEAESIVGVSGARFLTDSTVRAAGVADVGYESNLNYELIVNLKPDVVFVYEVAGQNSVLVEKLRSLGVRIVYIADYLENEPLGRAEWIKVFGAFYGDPERCDSLFGVVSRDYNSAKALITDSVVRPKVMLNSPWQDSWFVPGDRNYFVRLLDDAGGDYLCKGTDSDRSRPISNEVALMKCMEADFWLSPGGAVSMEEVVAANPLFGDVPAVRNGKVFNNNARNTPEGGSDFWESGAVYPNIILKDMIRIMHPELLPEHKLYYFRELK